MASDLTLQEQWNATFQKLQRNEYFDREGQLELQQKLQDLSRQMGEAGVKERAAATEADQARRDRDRRIDLLTRQWLEGKPEERTAARAELDAMSAAEQQKSNT